MTALFDTEAVPTSPISLLSIHFVRSFPHPRPECPTGNHPQSCRRTQLRSSNSSMFSWGCTRASFFPRMHQRYGLTVTPRYEWFLSLKFDFSFLLGRKRFRWPMVVPLYTIPLGLFSSLSRFSTSRTDISFFSR